MVMEQGNRGQTISLRLTDQEQEMLAERMKQAGISKKSAYLRKMAMNGYILKLDIPEIREMISLMRYSSNNLNQITKRVNETVGFTETTCRRSRIPRTGYGMGSTRSCESSNRSNDV